MKRRRPYWTASLVHTDTTLRIGAWSLVAQRNGLWSALRVGLQIDAMGASAGSQRGAQEAAEWCVQRKERGLHVGFMCPPWQRKRTLKIRRRELGRRREHADR